MVRTLLLIVAFPHLVLSQTRPVPAAPVPSPFEVTQALRQNPSSAEFTRWMSRLGLPANLDWDGWEFEGPECERASCSAYLTQGAATAVVVSSQIFFRIIWMEYAYRDRAWSVRGYLDGGSRYGVTARFFSRYILLETTGVQGFPSSSMVQALYEPRGGKLVCVLDLPSDGYDRGSRVQPDRDWNVTPVDYYFVEGRPEQIDVYARLVLPDSDDDAPHLADERRLATYIRPPGASAFTLDPKRSDLTQRDLDDLFRVHDGTTPDPTLLLIFARPSLLRLARTGTAPHRRWLSDYLTQAPASPAKSELLRALRPAPSSKPAAR